MRGRSYTPSPPRRSHGRRERSPSPRDRNGGGRGSGKDLPTSLLVRNLRRDCRADELRRKFGQFGPLKDIYLPRDYHSGEPRGFGFIQFVDPDDAAEAKYHMDGHVLLGRQLTVVYAEENRKKPTDMRARERVRAPSDRRRSPPRRSRSRSPRRSRSPPRRSARSRSHRDYSPSPSPKRSRYSRSVSPQDRRRKTSSRRSADRSLSRSPQPLDGSKSRSQSPINKQSRSPSPSRSRSPETEKHPKEPIRNSSPSE